MATKRPVPVKNPARKPPARSVPVIRLTYPPNGHRCFESSTFVVGKVPVGLKARVNGRLTLTSPQGFFSGKVDLKDGPNTVMIQAVASANAPAQASRSVIVHRAPPLPVLPALPLQVRAQTVMPSGNTILMPGDYLTVAFSASVDSELQLEIPGVLPQAVPLLPAGQGPDAETGPYIDNRTIVFLEPHQTAVRIPVRGYYRATFRIPESARSVENAPMRLVMRHGATSAVKLLPGTLSVWTQPRRARVIRDLAVTRVGPGTESARLTPQRAGTQVWVNGLQEGWARIRLDEREVFYIEMDDLRLEPDPTEARPAPLSDIALQPGKTPWQSRLLLATPTQTPLTIQCAREQGEWLLHLRLYDTFSQCDFVRDLAQSPLVKRVGWRQVTPNLVEITAAIDRLCGFHYAYTPQGWEIVLKSLPDEPAQVRVLIDPGHGGTETGATGPDGRPEKQLNLAVSMLLAQALRREGFTVSMTRTTDVPVALEARSAQAAREDADVVMSIHHNALPDGRDPLKAVGACTFFYHAFSEPFAQTLQAALAAQGSPDQGAFYNNLHLTRIHQGLAVLVELGYFTHPDDYERVINPAFQQSETNALGRALKDFVRRKS